mgnify:CR=1 FL=1
MAFAIKCKMNHPRGFMRRDELVFDSKEATYLEGLTDGLLIEKEKSEQGIGWLIFEEVSEDEIPEPDSSQDIQEDLNLLRVKQLREIADSMKLSLPNSLRKEEVISSILESGKDIPSPEIDPQK